MDQELSALGITSTGDLRNIPLAALTQRFGERNAKYMYYACRGEVVSMDDCCSWTYDFMGCMHLAGGLHTKVCIATMRPSLQSSCLHAFHCNVMLCRTRRLLFRVELQSPSL